MFQDTRKYISLGKDYDYVQFIYYQGVKYYNTDYAGTGDEEIILQKLE